MSLLKGKQKEIRNFLVNELSGTELQSLLIEVFSSRSSSISREQLLANWQNNRFVQVCQSSPLDFLDVTRAAYEAAADFKALELSPVCPLGTHTIHSQLSQNRILSTIRNTELIGDATNVLALECAVRRKEILAVDPRSPVLVKLCTSHRLLRCQNHPDSTVSPHFRIFSLCTAGRDTGSFQFESESMSDHIGVYLRFLRSLTEKGYDFGEVSLLIFGQDNLLRGKIIDAIKAKEPRLNVWNGAQQKNYYGKASFRIDVKSVQLGYTNLFYGGFTDWTAYLTANNKERFLASGINLGGLVANFNSFASDQRIEKQERELCFK